MEWTKFRNRIIHFLYTRFLKPIYFRIDPERVHDQMTFFGKFLGSNPFTRFLVRLAFFYQNPMLEQKILGIRFKNPIGLAAGFDKDAHLTKVLPAVGFGFEEIGSISGEPCEGNKKPRLWRHPDIQSLRVYYGLKNDGADAIAVRLHNKKFAFPIGTSMVKANSLKTCELEEGIADYVKAFKAFTRIGDYFTINISCPNAYGGEPFTDPVRLDKLLKEIDKISTQKPVFIKFAANLSEPELDALIKVVEAHRIHGFICTNLNKKHELGDGGLSGKAVEELSTKQIAYLYKKTKGRYPIIGVGGIFSAQDAYKKILAGASLLQLITGMIFEGPQLISEINRGLTELLKKDGYKSLKEAVGKNAQ